MKIELLLQRKDVLARVMAVLIVFLMIVGFIRIRRR